MKYLLHLELLMVFIFIAIQANAQQEDNRSKADEKFSDRVFFGGNFGLQFGNNITSIEVSPLVGYQLTDRFSAGFGVTYIYFKIDDGLFDYETNVYGGRIFGRYNFLENFFAHAEFENMNLETGRINARDEVQFQREWVPGLLIGGGVFQPIGRRGGVFISVLYNVLYEDGRSPYADPLVIRGGFTF